MGYEFIYYIHGYILVDPIHCDKFRPIAVLLFASAVVTVENTVHRSILNHEPQEWQSA